MIYHFKVGTHSDTNEEMILYSYFEGNDEYELVFYKSDTNKYYILYDDPYDPEWLEL